MLQQKADALYLALTETMAATSSCDEQTRGALLVRGGSVIGATGTDSPPGTPACHAVGHQHMHERRLVADPKGMGGRAWHEFVTCTRGCSAEQALIATCARYGIGTQDATCYVTSVPSHADAKLLIAAGVSAISALYDSAQSTDSKTLLGEAGVTLTVLHSTIEWPPEPEPAEEAMA